MKILFLLMIAGFLSGIISKFITGGIYNRMENDTSHPLVKQIRLKYDNYCKLGIQINNISAFVEKSVQNYHFGGLNLNSWNNISREMAYICVACGILETIIYHEDFSGAAFGLGIAVLCVLALRLTSDIIDTANRRHAVIINLIDSLDNNSTRLEPVQPEVKKHFTREASNEFNRLNKSFHKIQATSPKKRVDVQVLAEILDEYLS